MSLIAIGDGPDAGGCVGRLGAVLTGLSAIGRQTGLGRTGRWV